MITTDVLSQTQRTALGALTRAVTAHDGVAPIDEAGEYAMTGSDATHLLLGAEGAASADGAGAGPAEQDAEETKLASDAVIGYAGILADGTVQGMVHPAHRRRGHGSALLAAALELRPDAGIWAHGALPASLDFLHRRGLEDVRRLLVLHRPLDEEHPLGPVPPARLEGLEVSGFDVERDAEDWLAVNAAAFADHPEQGRLTRADLDQRLAEPWFDPADLLVARHEGALIGFVWVKRVSDEEAEIYVVGTAPSAQGTGVAGHLMGLTLHRLAEQGESGVELYVEGDNSAALALYERWGFVTADDHVQLRLPAQG